MRMSRSTGATSSAGSSSVVRRNVASAPASRLRSCSAFAANTLPTPAYSCAKTIASRRVSSPVRNLVQNSRTDAGEPRSACSAKMCSFFVAARSAGSSSAVYGCSSGCGESAMMCAPREASAEMTVRPSGVNAPYCGGQ